MRTAVASRWPQRLSPAAFTSRSISRSVRYSRGRRLATVTFTAVGGCSNVCRFSMVLAPLTRSTVTIKYRTATVSQRQSVLAVPINHPLTQAVPAPLPGKCDGHHKKVFLLERSDGHHITEQ